MGTYKTRVLDFKNSEYEICKKRKEISRLLLLKSMNIRTVHIDSISVKDLKILLDLYDLIFFDGWFKRTLNDNLRFSLSRRMTKSAGKVICTKEGSDSKNGAVNYEIRIGVDLLFYYDTTDRNKKVCGINTYNSLSALQIVFEHELCHVVEFYHFNSTNCNGKRFKMVALNIFGHTESYHLLPTRESIAYSGYGLKKGDVVYFNHEGKKLKGTISNINKRATVMVKSEEGCYVDGQGMRHLKYYVPLTLLKRSAH